MRSRNNSIGSLILLMLSVCSIVFLQAAWGQESEAPIVETENGQVRGSQLDDSIQVFKGIPFAAPPVGELRWQLPQPSEDWSGVRDATEFGDSCTQPPGVLGPLGSGISEDCLYLNVWTSTNSEDPQPVMVWIHGGAFLFGSGSQAMYDGATFAKSNIVLVTVNYRLANAGFFSHPALSAESSAGVSGNQGIHDQLAALRWVQENISAFGGDPDNVTIFGESAGSMSVCYLVATPLSRGLFHKAIGQSGGCFGKHPTLDEPLTDPDQDQGEITGGGHAVGLRVATAMGATAEGEEAIAQLRSMSLMNLGFNLRNAGVSVPFRSVYVDGYLFPDQMRTLIAEGKGNAVPIMVGSNTDEGANLFQNLPETDIDTWKQGVATQLGEDAEEFIGLYMADAEDSTKIASQQMTADPIFAWEMRTWAAANALRDDPAYLYVFSHPAVWPGIGRSLGAVHAGEINYVFHRVSSEGWNDEDRALAEHMHAYWVNFAKTGDPNGEGLPSWPAYDVDADEAMNMKANPEPMANYRKAKIDAWERRLKL